MDIELAKQVLNEINLARTNPVNYSFTLETYHSGYTGTSVSLPNRPPIATIEGVSVCNSAIQMLRQSSPKQPLVWCDELSQAAQEHCVDKNTTATFGHTGSGGTTLMERLVRFGKPSDPIGENIGYGYTSPQDIVVFMLIDDGNPCRGNRRNLMNENFKMCGVGITRHRELGSICTVDFAGGFSPGQRTDEFLMNNYSVLLGEHSGLDDYYSGRPGLKLDTWSGPIMERIPQDLKQQVQSFSREVPRSVKQTIGITGEVKQPNLPAGVKNMREVKYYQGSTGEKKLRHVKLYVLSDGTEVSEETTY